MKQEAYDILERIKRLELEKRDIMNRQRIVQEYIRDNSFYSRLEEFLYAPRIILRPQGVEFRRQFRQYEEMLTKELSKEAVDDDVVCGIIRNMNFRPVLYEDVKGKLYKHAGKIRSEYDAISSEQRKIARRLKAVQKKIGKHRETKRDTATSQTLFGKGLSDIISESEIADDIIFERTLKEQLNEVQTRGLEFERKNRVKSLQSTDSIKGLEVEIKNYKSQLYGVCKDYIDQVVREYTTNEEAIAVARRETKKALWRIDYLEKDLDLNNLVRTIIRQNLDIPIDDLREDVFVSFEELNETHGEEYVLEHLDGVEGNYDAFHLPNPEDLVSDKQLAEETKKVLGSLTEREKDTIEKRFGIGTDSDESLDEVAKDLNVTRERVRQIEAKALMKLRHARTHKPLKPFIEALPVT